MSHDPVRRHSPTTAVCADVFSPDCDGRRGTLNRSRWQTCTYGIAFRPFPSMPGYAASTAAVHAFSEALRAQFDGTYDGLVAQRFQSLALLPSRERLMPFPLIGGLIAHP